MVVEFTPIPIDGTKVMGLDLSVNNIATASTGLRMEGMEQLKDIRSKTKTWSKHLNQMVAGWSFYQLQQFVTYKAAAFGNAVEFVNPAYTSQTCHHCLKSGSRKGERFTCLPRGEQHADVNASHMIALGGAACKPARISARKGS
jgi:transposase